MPDALKRARGQPREQRLTVAPSLVSTIYGGTSEIQRGIIAKTLGL
jgi:alkylation response protein AidB-like acyl-CoA dehydrogenase